LRRYRARSLIRQNVPAATQTANAPAYVMATMPEIDTFANGENDSDPAGGVCI
jgi:hypothetical protein